MFNAIMGRKLGCTRIFEKDEMIPVTVIEAGPCRIVNIRTLEKDGYNAVQLGYNLVPENKLNKPTAGYYKKLGVDFYKYLKEFRAEDVKDVKPNELVTVEAFKVGDLVDVTGKSKGKGFQGVVKRHGFKGGPESHGSMFHRAPGSIGSNTFPGRVIKNKKLAGRMGNERVTVKHLEIVKLIPEKNIMFLKGAVPGSINSILYIKGLPRR
ncbi:MAG: 50S ribosomal protein L3 [bacterium]